jgi:MerR family transcriptional regulator, light-induced transcriptional regulator
MGCGSIQDMKDDNARTRAPEGNGALHPIGVVAKRTGLTLHVLRAWERRYGVVSPRRTTGGQRLYTDADVTRLRLLRLLTEAGRNISQVAGLPDVELERLASEHVGGVPEQAQPTGAAAYRARSIAAAGRLDGDSVHATLMRAVVSLRPLEFLEEVLMPLLQEVGELWHRGKLSPAQEHVVSMAARRVVSWLLDAYEAPPGAPVLLVTTVAAEQHEFGALMVSVVALDMGWQVSYLGPSLPATEIAGAALRVGAAVVAVSIVNTDDAAAVREVADVRAALPATVQVLVGGAGAAARHASLERPGVVVITEVEALSEWLRLQHDLLSGGTS